MASVEGISRVLFKLNALANRFGGGAKLVLGYRAPYAVYVHENLSAHHAPPTKAKFLEGPARRMIPQVAKTIADEVQKGSSVEDALLKAGNEVMDESQKEVPVDKGDLKASAFVTLERV